MYYSSIQEAWCLAWCFLFPLGCWLSLCMDTTGRWRSIQPAEEMLRPRLTSLSGSPWPVSLYFTWSTSWPAPSPSAPRLFLWISSLSSSLRHYPSLHSVILIMGNPRMKQTCERILWKTVCAWRAQGLWAGERGVVRRLFWNNFLIALPKRTDLKNFLSPLKNFLFYIGV